MYFAANLQTCEAGENFVLAAPNGIESLLPIVNEERIDDHAVVSGFDESRKPARGINHHRQSCAARSHRHAIDGTAGHSGRCGQRRGALRTWGVCAVTYLARDLVVAHIFPRAPGDTFGGPTMPAVAAAGLIDLIIFCTMVYAVLSWRARRKIRV